ncbi:hypothetical protein [Kribbella monticola]|uniref:hypothetical protein n=1 Tax=Kribbella monticola TaxID=2185285 RepID=UPI000DD3443E|nr:hypothetical protein [Kribbella monticola]
MVLRSLAAATAAVVLLAGCSGGDDKSTDSSKDGASQTPGTPSAPALTPYDPPKSFEATYAYSLPEVTGHSSFKPEVAMVGSTAVANSLRGVDGQNLAGPAKPWQTLATETTDGSVVINDASVPVAVQLNGKPAVAVAYYQRVKGAGTAKPGVSVLFRWLDPADGKPLSEATFDVTALLGDAEVNSGLPGGFTNLTFDPATGQVAVGVSPASMIGAKSGIVTVIADPATKKAVGLPFMRPAGLSKGVLVGTQGKENTRRTVALVDAATGRITKSGLLPGLEGLTPTGANGSKYVYLYGQKYDKSIGFAGDYVGYFYAVDPASGAVVQTKTAVKKTQYLQNYSCFADGQKTVVCTADQPEAAEAEIVGFDDTTGKKTWGFTEASAGRVVPQVTAAFHGVLYASAETKPVLLNALTGQDIPTPTPTVPTGADTAGPTGTPGETPSEDPTPTDSSSPSGGSSGAPVAAQPANQLQSPQSVSEYGGVYLAEPELSDDFSGTLQILKAVG